MPLKVWHHSRCIGNVYLQYMYSLSEWKSFKFEVYSQLTGPGDLSLTAVISVLWKEHRSSSHVPVFILCFTCLSQWSLIVCDFSLVGVSHSWYKNPLSLRKAKMRKEAMEKKKGKTEECVWLAQVCCSWQTVWEPRSHCVPHACMNVTTNRDTKKRQTWETCALTFLNQIWQSGGATNSIPFAIPFNS